MRPTRVTSPKPPFRRAMAPALILAGLAWTLPLSPAAGSDEVHPKKTEFAGYEKWKPTRPGDVRLKAFKPFRAVYQRTYKQGSGPQQGQKRQDRVSVTAEIAGWDGVEAVLLNVNDSGIPGKKDTNGRTLAMYIAREDMRLLFEMGPIPGKAKDYYIARVMPDRVQATLVTSESGETQKQGGETSAPGFGPASWVFASMKLKKGQNIRLEPVYSMGGNPLTFHSQGRVAGQEPFTDVSGKVHQAWVVESFWNLRDGRILRIYLVPEPPYYLGTESLDLETGKRKDFLRLESFRYLDE